MSALTVTEPREQGDQGERGVSTVLDAAHAARVAEAVEHAVSDATRERYASAVRRFDAWVRLNGYADRRWSAEVVAAYLATLSTSPSNVQVSRAAILDAARRVDVETYNALRDNPGLRATMRGLTRESRGWERQKARAFSRTDIREMVERAATTPAGQRDKAILLLGVSLGLRASDLVSVKTRGVVEVRGGMEVVVPYSKTSDEPITLALPEIGGPLCAVSALRTWLATLEKIEDERRGHVVRQVRRGGYTVEPGAVSTEVIGRIVTRMAASVGLPAGRGGYTAHSLRATFATNALQAGYSEQAVSSVGRWSSLQVLRGYDRSTRWDSRLTAGGWLGR
ncbi:tyrosine-type recombinase/integrase [Xylanimonas oleitrophica]|nr:tyrosine-type recombinase/integrase [Xylanimonas oleitrophica]